MKLDLDPRIPQSNSSALWPRITELFRNIAQQVNAHEDGFTFNGVSVSASYTMLASDSVVFCNASGGARTITLPAAAAAKGRLLVFRKTEGSANNVTLSPAAGNIDGAASLALTAAAPKATLVSDGTNYFTV